MKPKPLGEFKNLKVEEKLDYIYHVLTNHLSEHKVLDIFVIGVAIGIFLLLLNVAIERF